MDKFEFFYENSLKEIYRISNEIRNSNEFEVDVHRITKSGSSLDAADYCFTLFFGIVGALISTNGKLEAYLADIHKVASGSDGDYDGFQVMMGKLFHHQGDAIDKMVKRDGSVTDIRFHRLLWGHDIFSRGEDNPFSLMINQKGSKLGGILQALRHLIADTMSKQGLPAPGTSLFDYTNGQGKTTNYIIDILNNLSIQAFDNKAMAREIYSHLFTIRMQDLTGGILARSLTEVYFRIRKIDDELRKSQMTFMVYAINFFMEAVVGSVRQKGIPYINIPVGTAMLTSFARYCALDADRTRKLTNRTKELTEITLEITKRHNYHSTLLTKYSTAEEILDSMEQSESNMDALIEFLGR